MQIDLDILVRKYRQISPRSASRSAPLLLLLPLLVLSGSFAGPGGLVVALLCLPTAIWIVWPDGRTVDDNPRDQVTGMIQRPGIVHVLDQTLGRSFRNGGATGALVIEIDQFKTIEERHSRAGIEYLIRVTADRLSATLRETDTAARLDGPCFAVALSPARRLDLEAAIQLSTRIQHALSEPIPLDGVNVYVTVSIGFCLESRIKDATGATLLQAAIAALIEAQRYSPAAIRSYSSAMQSRITNRSELIAQIGKAIDQRQIRAYFQPQISTRTGKITGFETLARWQHPKRGLIPPIEFLPALEQAGLMDQLGAIMVSDALTALRRWDEKGFEINHIGVNFSTEELRDPRLSDRIQTQLKHHDLSPDRLVVEVLETVVANHADDIVLRNLSALAQLGCKLDLDDFGTGHASITSIRRYSVERIKIDRSFVTRIDNDTEQQKMVSAILTMADRLGLDTLAEGVETPEEQAMLAKLGCGHVQGFGIARPMPAEEVDAWISAYQGRSNTPIPFRKKVS